MKNKALYQIERSGRVGYPTLFACLQEARLRENASSGTQNILIAGMRLASYFLVVEAAGVTLFHTNRSSRKATPHHEHQTETNKNSSRGQPPGQQI